METNIKHLLWSMVIISIGLFIYTAEREFEKLERVPKYTVSMGNGTEYIVSVKNTNWFIQTYVDIRIKLKTEVH